MSPEDEAKLRNSLQKHGHVRRSWCAPWKTAPWRSWAASTVLRCPSTWGYEVHGLAIRCITALPSLQHESFFNLYKRFRQRLNHIIYENVNYSRSMPSRFKDKASLRIRTLHLHNLIKKLGGIDLFFLSSGVGHQNRDLQPDIELNTARTNVEGFTRMVTAAFNYFKEKAPDILLSSVPLQALKDWALHRPTLPPNASRIPISKRWHNLPGCSILIYTSPTSVRDLLPPIY